MKKILLTLAVLFAGCGDGFEMADDAGASDARPDTECTVWGVNIVCDTDGACHGAGLICTSYTLQACPPGPWPCDVDR